MPLESPDHRYLGIELNQQTWALLGRGDREAKGDRRMIQFARGSLYHLRRAEGFEPVNEQRGRWLMARVHAVLGEGALALVEAQACMAVTTAEGLEGFDAAYAHEAMARAEACAGDLNAAAASYQAAMEAGAAIESAEDRRWFEEDLASGPWFGLKAEEKG